MSTPKTKEVHCCDCGLRAEIDASQFTPPGWQLLQLTGRVRCTNCARDLDLVNHPQIPPLGEIEP